MQVLQRYHRVQIPQPGMELEFLPGQDLQPMHYLRCALLMFGSTCLVACDAVPDASLKHYHYSYSRPLAMSPVAMQLHVTVLACRERAEHAHTASLPLLAQACGKGSLLMRRPSGGIAAARIHRTAVAEAEAEAADSLSLWAVATLASMLSLDNILAVLSCAARLLAAYCMPVLQVVSCMLPSALDLSQLQQQRRAL